MAVSRKDEAIQAAKDRQIPLIHVAVEFQRIVKSESSVVHTEHPLGVVLWRDDDNRCTAVKVTNGKPQFYGKVRCIHCGEFVIASIPENDKPMRKPPDLLRQFTLSLITVPAGTAVAVRRMAAVVAVRVAGVRRTRAVKRTGGLE